MRRYFDTTVLLKIYVHEENSDDAIALIRSVPPPLPFAHQYRRPGRFVGNLPILLLVHKGNPSVYRCVKIGEFNPPIEGCFRKKYGTKPRYQKKPISRLYNP